MKRIGGRKHMHLRKPVLLIIFEVFLLVSLAQAGCSSKEEATKESLYPKVREKILQEKQQNDQRSKGDGAVRDEGSRKNLLAVADACDKQYVRCTEKCEDSTCEDSCMKTLEMCEKNLPEDLKTIK
jgi:hypothetical protein